MVIFLFIVLFFLQLIPVLAFLKMYFSVIIHIYHIKSYNMQEFVKEQKQTNMI